MAALNQYCRVGLPVLNAMTNKFLDRKVER